MHQVFEQDRRFYFVVSATLGVDLRTGDPRLDLNYLKDAFECMGDSPMPDTGMPKPNGEFLVSGGFYSINGQPVTGGEVAVRLGEKEKKKLYVFGPRKWKGGFPSDPEPITYMPLDYTKAFGGKGYDKNPDGMGYNDGLLPCIEYPESLVTARGDIPEPAGFAPLYFMLPQRTKYQGTYDTDYKKKYFPGYPADHDWRYHLCAPREQWIGNYYQGDERFELYNMHPEMHLIEGELPGYYARCFVNQVTHGRESFGELPLNLDTIWFFPEKCLALLIFRGVLEVADDEAETISHVLAAYENRSVTPRSLDYYRNALEKRKNSSEALLKNLDTPDLIPDGHKSAMALLIGGALDGVQESEIGKNMDAKSASFQKMADEKIEESIQRSEDIIEDIEIPDGYGHLPENGCKLDIRKMMEQGYEAAPDPDTQQLNNTLEAIMPGITSGNFKNVDMSKFSFDKIDEIFAAVDVFSEKKEKLAKEAGLKEVEKQKQQLQDEIGAIDHRIEEIGTESGETEIQEELKDLENSKIKLIESRDALNCIDLDRTSKNPVPLPRLNADEIRNQADSINPEVAEVIQHMEHANVTGMEGRDTDDFEQMLGEMMGENKKQIDQALKEAEESFKEAYILGAHFMGEGTPPHKDPLDVIKQRFLDAFSRGEPLAGGDWACIDLSGENLDGVDLSGAFLEQVNFRGASLKGALLKGAILARAVLDEADFSGADLEEANVGAVHAHATVFTNANLRSAKLSKGDFTNADFSGAVLEDIESLEIGLDGARFVGARMPGTTFLDIRIDGAVFSNAEMGSCVFLQCVVKNCDFRDAVMQRCAFVDTSLHSVCFDRSDLSNACFATTDPEKSAMADLTFRGARLAQANFQNMDMKKALLSGANLENAYFGGTELSGADLAGAYAKNAQFRKANLTGARLDGIDLTAGSLAKARLVGASFRWANLYQADFLRSTITDTDFSGSNLDSTLIEHWRPK